MADRKLISSGPIPLDQIEIVDRMRPVSESAVTALVASIEEVGRLMDEIHVRRMPGGLKKNKGKPYRLIAGGHRCAAAVRLGWAEIPAKVWQCNGAQAKLMEIDDNLAHAELAPLDLAFFLAERKRVYERENPGAAWGGDRGNQHTGGRQTDTMSFCQSIAEQRGLTDRHVRRILAVGGTLRANDIVALRASERPITLKDLQDLAKVRDEEQRSHACLQIATGAAKSVKAALAAPSEPVSQDQRQLATLVAAWDRAGTLVRRKFLAERGHQIDLLTGGSAE